MWLDLSLLAARFPYDSPSHTVTLLELETSASKSLCTPTSRSSPLSPGPTLLISVAVVQLPACLLANPLGKPQGRQAEGSEFLAPGSHLQDADLIGLEQNPGSCEQFCKSSLSQSNVWFENYQVNGWTIA